MSAASYELKKTREAARNRKASKAGRDIRPLPKVVDPKRRGKCSRDFGAFCRTYHAAVFNLEWSADHLDVIRIIEDAVLNGGLFAVAMPRGSGKTSLALAAAEWALMYGHRSFVVLIGASEDAAVDLLEHIKIDLETNELLAADFPEVCHPIRKLDGITHRAAGQLLNGKRTDIGWTAKELILPTVPGSVASGAAVKVAGITGRIRGMSVTRSSDGATIRPDLVIIDDPQTDESARSPQQINHRLSLIHGAILGLAGPGKKIAGVMPITVIARGDVADKVLDRKAFPQWQGKRFRLMKSMPTAVKLWDEYADLRSHSLQEGRGITDATAFYCQHREAMDAGAHASWQARFNPDEVSATQHAMNLRLSSEEAFQAEYQNEPLSAYTETPLLLKPEQIAAKANSLPRGVVPQWAEKLTAYIDVQGAALFYVVAAWGAEFSGHVVEYGTYPEQPGNYFTLREVAKTLQKAKPGASFEGYIYDGLETLCGRLLNRDWQRDGGGTVRIDRCLIDANWGDSTAVVKQFVREGPFKAQLLPAHGWGITADRKPLNDYQPKPGERTGWCWRIMPPPDRHIVYDTNSFKTFIAQRWLQAAGEGGNLSLFAGSAAQHRMFAEHNCNEYPTPTEGMGRTVNVWRRKLSRDNHFLDCICGCAVAASEQGIISTGHKPAMPDIKRARRKINVSF